LFESAVEALAGATVAPACEAAGEPAAIAGVDRSVKRSVGTEDASPEDFWPELFPAPLSLPVSAGREGVSLSRAFFCKETAVPIDSDVAGGEESATIPARGRSVAVWRADSVLDEVASAGASSLTEAIS
jgi:hypothetical protein